METQDVKISSNRAKKIQLVEGISEKLGKSKGLVFTNYQGLKHKQLEELKKAIKPLQAEFVVAKNSLVLRALDANKIKVEESQFEGPTGTLIIYDDAVGPLKALAKLIKELGIPSVKFGILDEKTFSGEDVLKISALPGREVLLAQIAIGLKSPIFGLHRALNWNLQKLVMTLNAVTQSKPAIVADAPVVETTPAQVVEAPAEETPQVETIPAVEAAQEPETILAETSQELKAEETVAEKAVESAEIQAEEVVEEAKEETNEEVTPTSEDKEESKEVN